MKNTFSKFLLSISLSTMIIIPCTYASAGVSATGNDKVSIDFEISADGKTKKVEPKKEEVKKDKMDFEVNVKPKPKIKVEKEPADWSGHFFKPTPPKSSTADIVKSVGSDNQKYPVRKEIPKSAPVEKVDGGKVEYKDRPLADRREFIEFKTKSGKTLYLIIDRDADTANAKLVTEVSEQDLLNMVENPEQLRPKEEPKKEEPLPLPQEPVVVKEEKSNTWIYLGILGLVAVGGFLGYQKFISNQKSSIENEEYEEVDEDEQN